MTWSPRNRLSDEDDGNDRPGSSLSDISVNDEKKGTTILKNKNSPFLEHDESTSTNNLTLESTIKHPEDRESVDSPRKVHNGSTSSSKIWSVVDTLNPHKEEKPPVEKHLDTSGSSSLSSVSASTSVTSPPVSTASSTAPTLTPNATPLNMSLPSGIPMQPGKKLLTTQKYYETCKKFLA